MCCAALGIIMTRGTYNDLKVADQTARGGNVNEVASVRCSALSGYRGLTVR